MHAFITLDTIQDTDIGGLMSGNWEQMLPESVRKFKEQITSKLLMSNTLNKL